MCRTLNAIEIEHIWNVFLNSMIKAILFLIILRMAKFDLMLSNTWWTVFNFCDQFEFGEVQKVASQLQKAWKNHRENPNEKVCKIVTRKQKDYKKRRTSTKPDPINRHASEKDATRDPHDEMGLQNELGLFSIYPKVWFETLVLQSPAKSKTKL